MKPYILAAAVAFLTFSCDKKSTEITDNENISTDTIEIPATNDPIESSTLQTCYMEAVGKDSVFVTLEDNLGTITGKMRYKNFEKDSSSGDLIGNQNGDTIKLMYTFNAEGSTSEREIYFLKKDGKLVEGIGDHLDDKQTSKYESPSILKYEGHALEQVDCTNFEKNLKSK